MREFLPRLVALELTGRCNLRCVHCRASASLKEGKDELSLEEVKSIIDDIASFSKPILILTGGEPLVRKDIFEIASYASGKGLRVVLGTNGTLITAEIAKKLLDSGVKRASVSIDCAYAEEHDGFRGVKGAYELALQGVKACRDAGLEFQVNTTVTKRNLRELKKIHELARKSGAKAHHIFMLVPTGRGKAIEDEEITAEEYENVLNWIYDVQQEGVIHVKPTCAPQFSRIIHQRQGVAVAAGFDATGSGCMGGTSFAFISREGEVAPCGYLPLAAGNVRKQKFSEIWKNSELFLSLRKRKLKGKCGRCKYKITCSGCRARAYAKFGDYLDEEPYCVVTQNGVAPT